MAVTLRVAFHLTAFAVGFLLVYTVLTMFPSEEGQLQNRVENLWISVDDKQKTMVSRAMALSSRIAAYVTRIYNRILGERLISIQMIGVSSASSLAAFFIFSALLLYTLLYLSLSQNASVSPQFNVSLLVVD